MALTAPYVRVAGAAVRGRDDLSIASTLGAAPEPRRAGPLDLPRSSAQLLPGRVDQVSV